VLLLLLLYNNNDNNKHLFIPPSCVFLFGSHTRVFFLFFPFLFYLSAVTRNDMTWSNIDTKKGGGGKEREKRHWQKNDTHRWVKKKGEKLSRVDKESRRTVSVKKIRRLGHASSPHSQSLADTDEVGGVVGKGYISPHKHTHTQSLLNEKKMVKTTTTTEKEDYVCVDDDDERERPP